MLLSWYFNYLLNAFYIIKIASDWKIVYILLVLITQRECLTWKLNIITLSEFDVSLFWDLTQSKKPAWPWKTGLIGCPETSIRNYNYKLHNIPAVRRSQTAWPLKTGPIGCPKTSVNNYQHTLRNVPEEQRPQLHRGGNPRSLIVVCLHFHVTFAFKQRCHNEHCGVCVYCRNHLYN